GSTMFASVKSKEGTAFESIARTSTSDSGTKLGQDSAVGSTVSQSSTIEDLTSGLVTVTANSIATGVNLAGVFRVGSVTSSAAVKSDGSEPSGGTVFSDMSIGGQEAYVDGNGVHMGKPGKPANAEAAGIANAALASMGMSIYFT